MVTDWRKANDELPEIVLEEDIDCDGKKGIYRESKDVVIKRDGKYYCGRYCEVIIDDVKEETTWNVNGYDVVDTFYFEKEDMWSYIE